MEWLTGKHDLQRGYARLKWLSHHGGTTNLCHIFIILIVSCVSTTVTISNLNIIASIGTEVYSSPLK